MNRAYVARDGTGNNLEPGTGVVPILLQGEPRVLRVVGTGCYVARYGLVLTAGHVLAELQDEKALGASYVCHLAANDTVHFRQLLSVSWLIDRDLGIAQVDNYLERFPDNPLMNHRVRLSTRRPEIGEPLVTYAYPENLPLDFNRPENAREIRADMYPGRVLEHIGPRKRPYLPYPHIETSIEILGGASGGPVFDEEGSVIGVASRGWDFRGATDDESSLSSVVLIDDLLRLRLQLLAVPPASFEGQQLPAEQPEGGWTFRQLAELGHVILNRDRD
ncbi:MAG: serine protease [Steroidobacteraceae bacterium]